VILINSVSLGLHKGMTEVMRLGYYPKDAVDSGKHTHIW